MKIVELKLGQLLRLFFFTIVIFSSVISCYNIKTDKPNLLLIGSGGQNITVNPGANPSAGPSTDPSTDPSTSPSADPLITSYEMRLSDATLWNYKATIDETKKEITIEIPFFISDISKLEAQYNTNLAQVPTKYEELFNALETCGKNGNKLKDSGCKLHFPITVVHDGKQATYTVYINIAASNDARITEFKIGKAVGVIEQGTEGAITVQVPYKTDLSKLKATFTKMGESVVLIKSESGITTTQTQTSDETENDFSSILLFQGIAYDGTIKNYTVTVTANTELNFTQISTNENFTCGLIIDASIYCWGNGRKGELGEKDTYDSDPKDPSVTKHNGIRPKAQQVTMPEGIEFTQISTNITYSCALSTVGDAYCWGQSVFGNLGYRSKDSIITVGDAKFSPKPVQVEMPTGVQFKEISTNERYSCALTTNGKAYCWGDGLYGQMGNGANVNSPIPVPVIMPKTTQGEVIFTQISTNYNYSCALTTNGKVYCWGEGSRGTLGYTDIVKSAGSTKYLSQNIPVPVIMPKTTQGEVKFTQISTNYDYSCALTTVGDAYCWGLGDKGQMGNGANVNSPIPVQVTMPGEVKFTQISTNANFTCALTTNGKPYCWGGGVNQQSNEQVPYTKIPVEVTMPQDLIFTQIQTNKTFSCALSTEKDPYCWGWGLGGQLGNGDNLNSLIPVKVIMPKGLKFTQISTNFDFGCALSETNLSYCWGKASGYGRLGNGDISNTSSRPVKVVPVEQPKP